jgi:hypothetical protein
MKVTILTSTSRYLYGITLIATLLIFGFPGSAQAQNPPTGLISVNSLGNGSGNLPALNNALSVSSDGRYVAFVSEATDLAANDTNNGGDVFVRDRQTGQTILVSANAAGTGTADAPSRFPAITADGRYVAFTSFASNLVTDDAAIMIHEDVYVRDLRLGITTLVSRNLAGTARGNGTSGFNDHLGISADGRFVVFSSSSTDLVAQVDNNNNSTDVFVRDLQTRTTTLVSINRDGTGTGSSGAGGAVITPDGRFVAFMSQSRDLISMDTGFGRQVFVRDLQTGVTSLATVNKLGTGGGSADTDGRREQDLTISSDGRFVAFVSEANDLVENDSSGFAQDVFVRDMQQGVTHLVSVNTSGVSSNTAPSGQLAMTADGRFVAFVSGADNLVANIDTNLKQDVFVRDLQANTTTLISVNRTGTAGGNGNASGDLISSFQRPSISDDGRYVSFTSSANDLTFANDTNGGFHGNLPADVFVRDRQNGITTPVSMNYSGSDTGNGASGYSAVARDGRSIFYFSGASDLVSYDSNGGIQDLFVFVNIQEAGQVRFKLAATGAGENTGAVNVVVSLLGAQTAPVSINFNSINGTAIAGTDYVATSGTLTFAPGETEKTFSVSLIDDALDENAETVVLRLSSVNHSVPLGEPNIAVVSIADDDPSPTFKINDVTIAEGDAGNTSALFTISLSGPSDRHITVQLGTQAVTATAGIDFLSIGGQISFLPGQTTRQISVSVRGDTAVEGVETFFVNLVNPVNAVLADGQGVGTIVDDDALILLTEAGSQRAIALDSVIFTREPFSIINDRNFSADRRTRIAIFAVGLKLLGQDASAVSATAEDSQGRIYPLTVEFVGSVPSFSWLTQVVFKVNDELPAPGDVRVRISLRSISSNGVLIAIQP